MLFRQFLDSSTGSLSYLVAAGRDGPAIVIDPVAHQVELLARVVRSLDLDVLYALDTHQHADRPSGIAALRRLLGCMTAMSEHTRVPGIDHLLADGEVIDLGAGQLEVVYTPGHTRDSCSLVMDDRVFSGDTLLIGGTGRTDQLGGDPRRQYDSLFSRLLCLPGKTRVYPAHDYHGQCYSTIGEQRLCNPRLQVSSVDHYVGLMQRASLAAEPLQDEVARYRWHQSRSFRDLLHLQSSGPQAISGLV